MTLNAATLPAPIPKGVSVTGGAGWPVVPGPHMRWTVRTGRRIRQRPYHHLGGLSADNLAFLASMPADVDVEYG
jgi:hypothetical protein